MNNKYDLYPGPYLYRPLQKEETNTQVAFEYEDEITKNITNKTSLIIGKYNVNHPDYTFYREQPLEVVNIDVKRIELDNHLNYKINNTNKILLGVTYTNLTRDFKKYDMQSRWFETSPYTSSTTSSILNKITQKDIYLFKIHL